MHVILTTPHLSPQHPFLLLLFLQQRYVMNDVMEDSITRSDQATNNLTRFLLLLLLSLLVTYELVVGLGGLLTGRGRAGYL